VAFGSEGFVGSPGAGRTSFGAEFVSLSEFVNLTGGPVGLNDAGPGALTAGAVAVVRAVGALGFL
jgi:hypothetical protein